MVISLNNYILFKSQHEEGKLNLITDELSGDHIVPFEQSAPLAAYTELSVSVTVTH